MNTKKALTSLGEQTRWNVFRVTCTPGVGVLPTEFSTHNLLLTVSLSIPTFHIKVIRYLRDVVRKKRPDVCRTAQFFTKTTQSTQLYIQGTVLTVTQRGQPPSLPTSNMYSDGYLY
jgi:hypothetical protein